MTGKEKCEFLRNIRKNIAEMNGLDYDPRECTHEGWCPGYCSACDAESADLMRQLDRKESSGSPIRIDTESIKALEEMAKEQLIHIDNDDTNEILGMEEMPESIQLEGDVMTPDDTAGIMPQPPREDDEETMLPMGLPAFDPRREVPLSPANPEALKDLEDKGITEGQYEVCSLCQDCQRFGTITVQNGLAVRCAALSEHFFAESITKGICWIKKLKDDEDYE